MSPIKSLFIDKVIIKIILIIVALSSAAGCHDHSKDTINIAGNEWLGYQPLFVAHQIANASHHAKREHLHGTPLQEIAHQVSLTSLPSTSTVMRVLGNQQLDAALLTLDEAITFADKTGMDLCVGLVLDYSNGADALVINPEMKPYLNKKPIKIGYESTALGGYMLSRAMDILDIASFNITPVTLEPNDHISAYESGQVDGIITFQPVLNKIQTLGAELIFSSNNIPGEIIDVMVVKKSSWKTHRAHFQQVIDILWKSGVDYIKKNDPRAVNLIQVLTQSTDDLETSFQGIHLVTPSENKEMLAQIEKTSIKKISDYLLKMGMIKKPSTLTACK